MEQTLEQIEKIVTDTVFKTGIALTSAEISKFTNQIQKCSLDGLRKRAVIFNEAFNELSKQANATDTGKEPISETKKTETKPKIRESITTLPGGKRI